jgi:hypothetical protein
MPSLKYLQYIVLTCIRTPLATKSLSINLAWLRSISAELRVRGNLQIRQLATTGVGAISFLPSFDVNIFFSVSFFLVGSSSHCHLQLVSSPHFSGQPRVLWPWRRLRPGCIISYHSPVSTRRNHWRTRNCAVWSERQAKGPKATLSFALSTS